MHKSSTQHSRGLTLASPPVLRATAAAWLLAASVVCQTAPPELEPDQRFPLSPAAASGSLVGTIELTQTDEVALPLTFTITSGDDDGVFAIQTHPDNAYAGQLVVANETPLAGLEIGNEFNLSVQVSNDDGTDTKLIRIVLYEPAILLTPSFVVEENAPAGTVVGLVEVDYGTPNVEFVVDPDSDPAALETFDLAPDGTLTVKDPALLDYEATSEFTFGIVATHLDRPESLGELRSTHLRITIALLDVNEPPQLPHQAFTIPTERTETFVGLLLATDPEDDPLEFEILALKVGGATTPNAFFTIREGNELHLIHSLASGLQPPTNSVITILVRETEREPALFSEADITVVAPKTYSFFGIPLLVPVPGHDGTVKGHPVQSMATGPSGEIYVVGIGADRLPYLDLYAAGFDAEPSRVRLAAGLVPTAVAATADRVYVAGTRSGPSSVARVYRYSTDGTLLNQVGLESTTYRWLSITDMLVDGASVYVCGSMQPLFGGPIAVWAELNSDTLIVQQNVVVSYSIGAPHVQYVHWGTATAITKEPGQPKIYVAGYYQFHRFWKTGLFNQNHHHRDSLSTFIGAYQNATLTHWRTAWSDRDAYRNDRDAYRIIKDLAFVEHQGSSYLYALEQFAWCKSMLSDDVASLESVVVSRLPTNLVDPSQKRRLWIRPSGVGRVVAGAMAVSRAVPGQEPSVYVTGIIPGGIDTIFHDGSRSEPVSPSSDRFFVTKVSLDFQMNTPWLPPLILSEFNYAIATRSELLPSLNHSTEHPRQPFTALLPYPAKKGVILAGNLRSGTLTLTQNANENSVVTEPSRNAGFLTFITSDKRFEEPVFLEVRSQFGRSGIDVLPHAGKRVAVQDKQYTVAVPSTLYVGADGGYLGAGPDQRPTDEEIATRAVTRYVCQGYTLEDTDIIGHSSSYSFVFRTNTTVTFHWQVEHALEIKSDLSGTDALFDPTSNTWVRNPDNGLGLTSTAGGNPEPSVRKHWIREDELATATIDGSVIDLGNLGTRYVVTGYRAEGAARGPTDPEVRRFSALEPRQKIDQFVMRAPAKITYTWGIQHRVQVGTSSLGSQDYPAIQLDTGSPRVFPGSGEFWFDRGSALLVGAEDVDHSLHGALLATGDLANRIPSKAALVHSFSVDTRSYLAQTIASLSQGTTVLWDYGDPIYRQTVSIGNVVRLHGPQAGSLPPAVADQINRHKEPRLRLIESPAGSTPTDMMQWDRVAHYVFPVRPGRFFLDFEKQNSAVDKEGNPLDFVILEITSQFPTNPHYPHTTHPQMPPVDLDPDPADDIAFLKLEYTTGNGAVDGNAFTATEAGHTVLLFSRTNPEAVPFVPAKGNRDRESLMVNVVRTTPWDDPVHGLDPASPAGIPVYVGTKITSVKDMAGLGTGFVVHTNAAYNHQIYDRRKVADAGPIIPVNRTYHVQDPTRDLVVVWYHRMDRILWPHYVEQFVARWPVALDPAALPRPLPDPETMWADGTNYLRRIVIASRLGSEGKDHALRDQLSFAADRYEEVSTYHQPDPGLGGYNPNEEHALIAPSFKFLEQANPPPVAYALRRDLNRTSPGPAYTSDPFVLVQYFDRGTGDGPGEFKMAVYAVELEDDHPQLNPDRHPAVDPDPADPTDQREFPYTFRYPMRAGEPVQPPYPLGLVIGAAPCHETRGENLTPGRVYWEDYRGQPWAVSDGMFQAFFYYPLLESFWVPDPHPGPGTPIAFPTAAEPRVTGTVANPQFLSNAQFQVGDVEVRLEGPSAADFARAVNQHPALTLRLHAAVLETGEIRLQATGLDTLQLLDAVGTPLAAAGLPTTLAPTLAVRYTATWPDRVPILKAGETLTFAGGEFKSDNPGLDTPGLPGVVGWAVGDVIYDALNPLMDNQQAFTTCTVRLVSPLEERTWQLTEADADSLRERIQPATGITRASGARWEFPKLSASLGRRVFFDPFNRQLGIKGFLNDKTLGDNTLTAAPPPVYVLEPNLLTPAEKQELSELVPAFPVWQQAVEELYAISRNPQILRRISGSDADRAAYYLGLESDVVQEYNQDKLDAQGRPLLIPNSARPQRGLGPGLALVPDAGFLDPSQELGESYVTLAENNDPDIGGPVTLHIIKVAKSHRYRGAIKTILSSNVFDERITLRHSGDFGGNVDDLVYQWFYREEDGTAAPLPPAMPWRLFPDRSPQAIKGAGMFQISLEGTGGVLLSDNLFFVRYRHRNDRPLLGDQAVDWTGTEWDRFGRFEADPGDPSARKIGTHWAGAANSPTVDGIYQPQLAMGWVKRVLDRINLFEARIDDFRNQPVPATYTSMIQAVGPRYEGPVALNQDKNVIENVGLIQLYATVLQRARGLSIDLSSPITTPGIQSALLLAATRLSDFHMLLGNEAYADAQNPTIGFGDDHMDFAGDFGSMAASMFAFQNQMSSLLEEELALLRGVPESYGRPVYNRLFWNFTKSLGEVAYVMTYNITDFNRDGFVDESDALALYPQGHGDAWGHYLTALKSHYQLLQHPYFNWISRTERYNLLDVVLDVDYLDERKFAEAAAARAKCGAEIVNLTYRSRYVEDPDGQWQGYSDIDPDRAWGVDGWARRAGQGALLDWITANALLPAQDTNVQHNALQKIDRTTVLDLATLSGHLGEIQSVYDQANNGLNPLGLAPDVVPFDIDATFNAVGSTAQIGRPTAQGLTHFQQIYERAVAAANNARTAFESANMVHHRQRQVVESTETFRQETWEQDLDFRNRLIEVFGTPHAGQIGAGKAYPAGYYGPDLMLWMYVAVNDVSSETVPPPSSSFTAAFAGFKQQVLGDPSVDDFEHTISTYFVNDLAGVTDVGRWDLQTNSILEISNLPAFASGYTFRAPAAWGQRASPGQLQLLIADMVQAEADLALGIADYDLEIRRIQDLVELLAAKHHASAEIMWIRRAQAIEFGIMNFAKIAARVVSASAQIGAAFAKDQFEASAEGFPKQSPTAGMAVSMGDIFFAARMALKSTGAATSNFQKLGAIIADKTADGINDAKEIIVAIDERKLAQENLTYELREQLKALEQVLRNEAIKRVEVFKRLEALRQMSDRYRATLEAGLRLLQDRQVFNIKAAGVTQRTRYQDMAFRVFRHDALQKYRAAFDLAARYTYLAAKAYDYETNLSPHDRGSAQGLLTLIARARTLGMFAGDEPVIGGSGLADVLATLRDNFKVLEGRMSFNNPQYERELISLRREFFRIPDGAEYDALWRQTLKQHRVADLWQVPEFRRYCRPPAPRSAGQLPGLLIPFGTEIVYGRNLFGWPLGAADHAYDPSVFATKIQSAAVYFADYPALHLAATPRVYWVPAGLDVLTIPTSPTLETRVWNIVDQAIPVPHAIGLSDLLNPGWIPARDSLDEPLGQIRRFSSFRAKDSREFNPDADALSFDTRLIGRSVWNTRWMLLIPGGSLLANGEEGLDTLIDGARVPGNPDERDLNGIRDILLFLHTYGYSGN